MSLTQLINNNKNEFQMKTIKQITKHSLYIIIAIFFISCNNDNQKYTCDFKLSESDKNLLYRGMIQEYSYKHGLSIDYDVLDSMYLVEKYKIEAR